MVANTGDTPLSIESTSNIWLENNTVGTNADSIQVFDLGTNAAGSSITNKGNIYLNGGEAAVTRTIGMSIFTSGTLTNDGTIIAQHATAMKISSSTTGSKIVNNGTINVSNGGYGITAQNVGQDNTIDNSGTINVAGSSSIGIYLENTQNTAVTNSGKILADDDSIAIMVYNSGADTGCSLTLKGDSHVEGKVLLSTNTTLTFDSLKNAETITLGLITTTKAATLANGDGDASQAPNASNGLKAVNLKNSHVTFKQASDHGLSFQDVAFEGNSTFALAEETQASIEGIISATNSGTATFAVSDLGQLTATQTASIADNTKVVTNYTGANVSDGLATHKLSLDDIYQDSLYTQIYGKEEEENKPTNVTSEANIEQGLVGDALNISFDDKGNHEVVVVKENQLTASNLDLAVVNALAWRNELQALSDRMSSLRTVPATAGVWVRYKGGEWDGNGVNQQFNGIELGADKQVTPNLMAGASFTYTKGEGDLSSGSADTDTFAGAAYLTYFQNGWYIDFMGKFGKVDSEFDLNYNGLQDKGDYSMTAFLAGVEAGYRFAYNQFYFEPQVQLTYSYLGDKQVKSDKRYIDFDSIQSVIGRIGFMSGYEFGSLGSAYLRASYYHDFDGEVQAGFSVDGDNFVAESDELDDNWGDVGVGANFNLGPANLFVDVSRTYGGDIDLEWKANAGMRYTF